MAERQKPHLVRAQVMNPDGTWEIKTIRHDSLNAPPQPQHEKLSDTQAARARAQWHRIGRLARPGIGEDGWVDQYRYDLHVDNEIDKWDHIANVFDRVGGNIMSGKQRDATLRAIVAFSIGTIDVESQTGLPEKTVDRLRRLFDETPAPRSGWHADVPDDAIHPWELMQAMSGDWRSRQSRIVEKIRDADIIILINNRTADKQLLLGEEIAKRVVETGIEEPAAVVYLAADFATDEPEICAAAVEVIRESGDTV